MTRYYTINGDVRPKRQHSNMVTAAWVVAAFIVFLLFAHYLVKAWNIELHDAAQVERMK